MNAVGAGFCAADRIAAVYDPGIVVPALDRKHNVAFFAIDGTLAPRISLLPMRII